MAEHTWIVVNIDGGPVGDGDFWHCSVCGVAGGPVFPKSWITRFESRGLKRWNGKERWDPFIPGAGASKKVSDDCDEAQKQIRAYILDERISEMRKSWCKPQAELLASTLLASTATDVTPLLKVLLDVERSRGHCRSLDEVRAALVAAGFTPAA